ncbi:hypothetical protein FISHEDRAFT_6081, partial [Fistulina hepatica ATCC 64428]
AIVSLRLVVETCRSALVVLANDTADADNRPVDLDVIHQDLLSLLSLIYTSTTKISLTLPAASYKAAVEPLKDIAAQTASLSHCARLFQSERHGAALVQEVRCVVKEVFEAVQALAQVFLDPPVPDENKEYLIKTGVVHDLVDNARKPGGLSKSNLGAVRRRWKRDQVVLEDGLSEVDDMIDDRQDDEVLDDFDDGWDELGLPSGKKMSDHEIARAKKVRPMVYDVIRVTILLHKRVSADLLAQDMNVSPTSLDAIQSASLAATSDDLISALYTPQDPSEISSGTQLFLDVVKNLRSSLKKPQPIATLGESSTNRNLLAKKRWFDTCFSQIESLSRE